MPESEEKCRRVSSKKTSAQIYIPRAMRCWSIKTNLSLCRWSYWKSAYAHTFELLLTSGADGRIGVDGHGGVSKLVSDVRVTVWARTTRI